MIVRYKELNDVNSNSTYEAKIVKDMGSVLGSLEVFLWYSRGQD